MQSPNRGLQNRAEWVFRTRIEVFRGITGARYPHPMTDFTDLRAHTSGAVLNPDDAGFADELSGFSLYYTHTPEAVVAASDATDVVQAVRFARANDLPARAFATGHGDHDTIGDGLVITTSRLDHVSIDPNTRIATIGAGTRWAPVVAAAAEHGLAPIAGSSANVGAVGYLLGGGLGPLARSHGFSSDYVRSYSVVTGTGELVEASALENPDLFWALRGGKGGLGIVTEVRVELVELPTIYGGSILFDSEHIETVVRAWADFTQSAPADVSTSIAIIRMPPIEQVPELLRGKTIAALRFVYPGAEADGERLLAPLRAVAPALLDSVGIMPMSDIALVHNDPTEPGLGWSTGVLLSRIDQDFVSTLLEDVGPERQAPLVAVELRHLGSATRRDVPETSAVGGRGAGYALSVVGTLQHPTLSPADAEGAVSAAAFGLIDELAPWVSPETTINFAGKPRNAAHFASAWPAKTFARLAEVRAAYDPDGVFPYGPRD